MTIGAVPSRILLVDDEESIRVTLGAIFEQEGYHVDAASSQVEALALIESNSYDAVITDLRLGDGDGLSIADALQRAHPGTPVIIITGYASLESAIKSIQRRVFEYLVKPSDTEQLKRAVRGAVERGRVIRRLRERVRALGTLADSGPPSLTDAGVILDEIERLVAEIEHADRDAPPGPPSDASPTQPSALV